MDVVENIFYRVEINNKTHRSEEKDEKDKKSESDGESEEKPKKQPRLIPKEKGTLSHSHSSVITHSFFL